MLSTELYQVPDTGKAVIQALDNEGWNEKSISVDVLRLDKIHPIISGNKWFKLRHYLQQAKQQQKKGILTFGGAWSNHLVAAAYAAKQAGLAAIGIVRGERPAELYASLQDVIRYDMQLQFVPRADFANASALMQKLHNQYPEYIIIPQGGQGETGVEGAAEIAELVPHQQYSHIACAVGTGTMMAGLVKASAPGQQVIGISSLKISSVDNEIEQFIQQYSHTNNYSLLYDFHFGGYARYTPPLLHFMNTLYTQQQLPTDFVYTGKLMYAIMQLIENNYFPPGSRLLVIHSGGLQGNRSLPKGSLVF